MVLMRNAKLAKKNAIKKGTRRKGKRFWNKKKNIMQKKRSRMNDINKTAEKTTGRQLHCRNEQYKLLSVVMRHFFILPGDASRGTRLLIEPDFRPKSVKTTIKNWCQFKRLQPQQKVVSCFTTAGSALTNRYPAANHILRAWFEYAEIRLIIAF